MLGKLVKQNATQSTSAVPASLDEIQQLLNNAHKQLKAKQSTAHDVLFHDYKKEGQAYCEQFWNTVKNQSAFDLPKPVMVAISKTEKEKMIETLRTYAKNNFDHYLSQDGKLVPEKYTDVGGLTWRLGPFVKGTSNNPKDLPRRFEDAWKSTTDFQGFFYKYHLLDDSVSTHVLYMQPYPVAGYVRPQVITFVKDQCDKCTGISIGVRIVGVTGLPQPDLRAGEYFSQGGFADTETKANLLHTMGSKKTYLLMGMGMFNGKLLFWTLEERVWVKTSAKVIDEEMGYDRGDGFRDYEITVSTLDEPKYGGHNSICSVKFN